MSDSQNNVGRTDKKDKKHMDSSSIKIDLEKTSSKSIDIEDDEVESVDLEEGDKKTGLKRQRKERSMVWQYFTKLHSKPIIGKVSCQCNKCKHVLSFVSSQGTGNFTRHIERCYGSVYKDVGQMLFNSYMKLSNEYTIVDQFLHSTYDEYVMLNVNDGLSTTSTTPSASNGNSKGVEATNDDSTCSNQVSLDELTEDIMLFNISCKSDASNSVNDSKV
ncbi:hypothetical protein E3N88_11665 [Mikania micrantha]|uniref:BED-type domain-containing protein n=1 Tax=Mikania micrantha TaxID=192012 RepID=A0A5N6P611_9ASTR|nr:hypothetical protein E3N88_11665 [Mikania micrantha]